MLSKIVVFYDNEITFGGSWDTDIFITGIISPKKIPRSVAEIIHAKKSSFRENINDDRTTFFLA